MEHTPPFYSSVDIRNAGFKLAPVDTNLFPGGWNNLTDEMLPLAVQAAMAAIDPYRRGQDRDNWVWIRDAEKNRLVVGTQARILY
ncbi:hypothetical protein EO238_29295, partial [Citrobacter sp. AAK_AS5]